MKKQNPLRSLRFERLVHRFVPAARYLPCDIHHDVWLCVRLMKRWCRGSLGGWQAGRVEIIAVPWLRSLWLGGALPGGGAGAGGRPRAASILPERSARGAASCQNSGLQPRPACVAPPGVGQVKSSRSRERLSYPYITTTSSSSQPPPRSVSASQGKMLLLSMGT